MMEQEEWSHVNRDLRHHGFPMVELTDPHSARGVSDMVLVSSEAAKVLRQTLTTLLRDCDRRQELIQELIVTNNQLREELSAQTNVTERYEVKTRDLQNLLDGSMLKIQELEDEESPLTSCNDDDTERLRNTKDAAAARCSQLSHQCALYQQEIERLQKKLKHNTAEEEKRKKKQSEVLQQMRRKWARGSSASDNVLTVIDYYESQVAELRQELELAQSGIQGDDYINQGSHNHHSNHSRSSHIEGATGNYKALIRSYENQLRDTKKKMKTLENDNELIKLDMQSRPQLKDLRDSQARVKKLERVLKKHGVCPIHDNGKTSKLLFSTSVEDIEFLPISQCRDHLKTVCVALNLMDVTESTDRIQELINDSESLPHLKQFSKSVLDAVGNRCRNTPHAIWCEQTTHDAISTIQDWHIQVQAQQELQQSLHRLVSSVLPSKHLKLHDNPSITDIIQQIDGIVAETEETNEKASPVKSRARGGKQPPPSKAMLEEVVKHFQNLFDVDSISGMYVRMNDIYTKLGEVHNITRTLRDLLRLDPECKLGVIVETVSRLSNRQQEITGEHIKQILDTDDLDSIVYKLKEHDDFFPIFHELLQKLMDILNVMRIDQVLPAIRALKLLAGS